MAASKLILDRFVAVVTTTFFLEGQAFTVPEAGTADANNKPDATDPAWLSMGNIKWNEENTGKTEDYMTPVGGVYQVERKIQLSVGLQFTGKFEKQSPLSLRLRRSLAALASTGGTVYNPLASASFLNCWIHQQQYNAARVLIDTCDVFCAVEAKKTNMDDKASETDITATVLYSTLNAGVLA